ncbi:MAG: sugar phosphate isomerase/epimerase [Alphaproteobacteria bacterium]|nr:sugar phosphate isomerase/epimerase [Alphaproteobacteria bacterium]
MHLSTHNWMRAEPLETTLRRIKSYGYESIEISGEPTQYKADDVRKLLKEYGIRCWGSVTLTLAERNLAAKNEAQRAKSVDYVKSVVRFAHELGGEEVTIVPATVGKIIPDGTPQEEWRWVVEALREVYGLASQLGVRMALEPLNRFETYFLNRADQAVALAKEVGPDCGVCLDAFHLNIEEADMLATIRSTGRHIADFHVADNNRMAPGQGALDWRRIVEALRSAGYDGALTVEFVAPVDRTPVSPWPDQIETNPVDISPEQLKFIQDHGSSVLSEKFYTTLVAKSAETLLPLIR